MWLSHYAQRVAFCNTRAIYVNRIIRFTISVQADQVINYSKYLYQTKDFYDHVFTVPTPQTSGWPECRWRGVELCNQVHSFLLDLKAIYLILRHYCFTIRWIWKSLHQEFLFLHQSIVQAATGYWEKNSCSLFLIKTWNMTESIWKGITAISLILPDR